jgi:hypothetical protein
MFVNNVNYLRKLEMLNCANCCIFEIAILWHVFEIYFLIGHLFVYYALIFWSVLIYSHDSHNTFRVPLISYTNFVTSEQLIMCIFVVVAC